MLWGAARPAWARGRRNRGPGVAVSAAPVVGAAGAGWRRGLRVLPAWAGDVLRPGGGTRPSWEPRVPDVATEPGSGGVCAGGRGVSGRPAAWGEPARQGGRRRGGVREAGDVGPRPNGPRELGEPQRETPRYPGEEGCTGSPGALGAGWGPGNFDEIGSDTIPGRKQPCDFGKPCWSGPRACLDAELKK